MVHKDDGKTFVDHCHEFFKGLPLLMRELPDASVFSADNGDPILESHDAVPQHHHTVGRQIRTCFVRPADVFMVPRYRQNPVSRSQFGEHCAEVFPNHRAKIFVDDITDEKNKIRAEAIDFSTRDFSLPRPMIVPRWISDTATIFIDLRP